jgi:hypothetical protein
VIPHCSVPITSVHTHPNNSSVEMQTAEKKRPNQSFSQFLLCAL